MSELIPEQKTTPLERAQWDYDRAELLLKKAKEQGAADIHHHLKRVSDTYGALLVMKHKANAGKK